MARAPTGTTESLSSPAAEGQQSAQQVGLRYVDDSMPGLARVATGKGFRYVGPDGKPVRERAELDRIKALAIPPAWTDVWICRWPNGHVQATGRDAKKRKQYRYHARWRSVRDEAKYERMISFGQVLPTIRAQVDAALGLPGLPREKVLAAIVYLLEATMIRIGNEAYARENESFGMTTLRKKHVRVDGSEIRFQFRGKSGIRHSVALRDKRLARIVKRTRDLPGQDLFQYVGEDGETHSIGSAEVNDYLRAISGEQYTAKDFRTWAGTLLAAQALQAFDAYESAVQAKKNILQAIEAAAEKLGNTPAICRKCYVHPAVIDAYLEGTLRDLLGTPQQRDDAARAAHALRIEEEALLLLLQKRQRQR